MMAMPCVATSPLRMILSPGRMRPMRMSAETLPNGVTLVNDQFVYVRGLGERYSSVQLNGAQVPSVSTL